MAHGNESGSGSGWREAGELASPSLLTARVGGPLAPPINLFLHRRLPRADRPPLFSCLFLSVCQLAPMCWKELTGEEERALRKPEGVSSGRRSCFTGCCEAFQPGPQTPELPSCSCPWVSSSRLGPGSRLYVPRGLCPGCPPSLPKLPPHPAPMSHLCHRPSHASGGPALLSGGLPASVSPHRPAHPPRPTARQAVTILSGWPVPQCEAEPERDVFLHWGTGGSLELRL